MTVWNSKPKKSGHDCRRRMFGNPKIGDGFCWLGKQRPAVTERIAGKRLAHAWLRAVGDRDGLSDEEIEEI